MGSAHQLLRPETEVSLVIVKTLLQSNIWNSTYIEHFLLSKVNAVCNSKHEGGKLNQGAPITKMGLFFSIYYII